MADRERTRLTPVPQSPPRKAEQSSVMFSLNELMQLEGQRIEEEHDREREARDREHAAKMEAELRLRVADEARRKADADRRTAEAQSMREEEARLAAMSAATVERARIDVLDRARLAELELVHKHEQALRRDAADRATSRIKIALVSVVAGSLLIGCASAGYYFGVVRPRDEASRVALATQAANAEAESRARQADVDDLTRQGIAIQRDIDVVRAQNSALPAPPVLPQTASSKPILRPTSVPTVVIRPGRVCTREEQIDPASSCVNGL